MSTLSAPGFTPRETCQILPVLSSVWGQKHWDVEDKRSHLPLSPSLCPPLLIVAFWWIIPTTKRSGVPRFGTRCVSFGLCPRLGSLKCFHVTLRPPPYLLLAWFRLVRWYPLRVTRTPVSPLSHSLPKDLLHWLDSVHSLVGRRVF